LFELYLVLSVFKIIVLKRYGEAENLTEINNYVNDSPIEIQFMFVLSGKNK